MFCCKKGIQVIASDFMYLCDELAFGNQVGTLQAFGLGLFKGTSFY